MEHHGLKKGIPGKDFEAAPMALAPVPVERVRKRVRERVREQVREQVQQQVEQ